VTIDRLVELVATRQPCVVLAGAGIWAQYDPMEYATIDVFGSSLEVYPSPGRRGGTLRSLADALPERP
jgi:tRNA(Arg) A34 adenosine deaminase TadA